MLRRFLSTLRSFRGLLIHPINYKDGALLRFVTSRRFRRLNSIVLPEILRYWKARVYIPIRRMEVSWLLQDGHFCRENIILLTVVIPDLPESLMQIKTQQRLLYIKEVSREWVILLPVRWTSSGFLDKIFIGKRQLKDIPIRIIR